MRIKTSIITLAFFQGLLFLPASAEEPLFVYVSPNRIGVNKSLMAMESAVQAAAGQYGAVAKTFEGSDPPTRRDNVQAALDLGAKVVVVYGFEFDDIIGDLAPLHPNASFIGVDACPVDPTTNVYCGRFRQHEASYLAGAEAALTSESGIVAAVGAVDIPYLHRYTDAFEAGATAARSDVKVLAPLWVGGNNPFQDPLRANTHAQQQIQLGADRIYAITAGGNGGIFQAAASHAGVLVTGLDVNQCPEQPGTLLDSVVINFDIVVFELVKRALRGDSENAVEFGLAENGLGLIGMTEEADESQCEIVNFPSEVITRLDEMRDSIVSGAVIIHDPVGAH